METTYTYDIYSFSDLHKDAYGRRPGNYYYEWLEAATNEERQKERRVTVLERLHQRYSALRTVRERMEILNEAKRP